MSADAWSCCPRCTRHRVKRAADREAAVREQYGKVSIDAFDRLREEAAAQSLEEAVAAPTLREDYEFVLDDNILRVIYKARCTECSLDFKIDEMHDIDPHEEDA